MRHMYIFALLLLVACAREPVAVAPPSPGEATAEGELRPKTRPVTLVVAPPPPSTARTAEEFDTTTAAERAAALEPSTPASQSLGTTIASLGNPAEPGFWLETPLVSTAAEGRVVYNDEIVTVALRPIEGPATAGSRLSLAAMRLLGAPLTGLPEVEVFLN